MPEDDRCLKKSQAGKESDKRAILEDVVKAGVSGKTPCEQRSEPVR